jgi:uncharacterized membrane protein YqgA involved in biofilm formation
MGGGLGVLLAGRLPERLRQTVVAGLGLFVLVLGVQTFLQTRNSLVVLGSLLVGSLLGEWWQVEEGIQNVGRWLEGRFSRRSAKKTAALGTSEDAQSLAKAQSERFVRGFFTASLVFCVGPIAILGSIENGMTGNYQLLAVKSILDGFAAMAFASSLGVGVLFSALPILLYQGSISLAAVQIRPLISDLMMGEMTATGGVLLVAIAISSLLEIKKIRTGSFLPALLIAPLLVFVLTLLGVNWASLP